MPTKPTLSIPEDLSRRAKARAALEGTSLSAVVRAHLEEFAAGLDVLTVRLKTGLETYGGLEEIDP